MTLTRRGAVIAASALLLPKPVPSRTRDFANAAAAYERATSGRVGFHARNVRSGATLAWRADDRFVMCSTFKASLAALVLAHVDRGTEDLRTPIPFTAADLHDWHAPVATANLARGALSIDAMCQAAVEQSDNTCATLLLDRIGGPGAITAFWRSIGDAVSRLDDPEPLLNRTPPVHDRDTTTPRAMEANLRRLVLGDVLSPRSRRLLRRWLVGSVTGFDRLRAGLPRSWTVGDKTGNNGADAAGDVAIAWTRPDEPIVIAAYTRGGRSNDWQLEELFSSLGAASARMRV